MSRKASFSVEPPRPRSSQHNNRNDKPKYLLEPDPNFDGNVYKKYGDYENDKQMKKDLEKLYNEKVGQRMQDIQKPALIKEVVISLEAHHTEKDVEELFKKLKDKYGGHEMLELGLHRDEGHFEDKKGMTYYPNKHIFYKDQKWYLNKELTEEADISKLIKVYNYHAHVKFTMMNLETGKTPQMNKSKYSERHKVTAEHLGLVYAPGPNRFQKRDIAEIKEEHHANREKKSEAIKDAIKPYKSKNKELKKKLEKKREITQKELADLKEQFRQEMIASELYYTKEDFQELNALFEQAQQDNSSKILDIEELSNDKTTYMEKINALETEIDTKDTIIVEKNTQIASYVTDIEQKDRKIAEMESAAQSASLEMEALKNLQPVIKEVKVIKEIPAEITLDDVLAFTTLVNSKDMTINEILGRKNKAIKKLQEEKTTLTHDLELKNHRIKNLNNEIEDSQKLIYTGEVFEELDVSETFVHHYEETWKDKAEGLEEKVETLEAEVSTLNRVISRMQQMLGKVLNAFKINIGENTKPEEVEKQLDEKLSLFNPPKDEIKIRSSLDHQQKSKIKGPKF